MIFAPDTPAIVGKEAIRKYVSEASAIFGFSIDWATDKIWISASGDLAYSSGTSQITVTTPEGKAITEHNQGLVVWKKQADSSWKCVADIWNADTPAATK